MRKPCCDKKDTNRGAWSKQEDLKLIDYIRKHGEGSWRTLPKAAGLLRCGKSCRLRWINYLRPDLKRGNFGEDEQDLIIKLHALLGNRWSLIAGRLPGRTDNEVKNYWNSHLRRKLTSMGVDPNNHKPNINIHGNNNQNYSQKIVTSGGAAGCLENPSNHNHHQPARSGSGGDQLSDGTSCLFLEDDSCHDDQQLLPDLNLDLTIMTTTTTAHHRHLFSSNNSVSLPDHHHNLEEEQQKPRIEDDDDSKMSRKSSEFESSAIICGLPLFS